jgi:hypothetical protein
VKIERIPPAYAAPVQGAKPLPQKPDAIAADAARAQTFGGWNVTPKNVDRRSRKSAQTRAGKRPMLPGAA